MLKVFVFVLLLVMNLCVLCGFCIGFECFCAFVISMC